MVKCSKCERNAYYGKKDNTPLFCRNHKELDMIHVTMPTCSHQECHSTSRTFGFPGEKGSYCKKHALEGMVNVKSKLCDQPGCTSTSRVFGNKNSRKRFCKEHSLSTMVNIVNPTCEFPDCHSTSRNFDLPGGKGRFCKHHKEENMIDVRSLRCKHEGCDNRPNFSFKGKPPQYCSKHKLIGMCNYRTCKHNGCTTFPCYNYSGETSGLFCASHKLDGMINIRTKTCKHSGCKKSPSFGTTTPQYCKTHATTEMRNLIAKYCSYPSCHIQAIYNVPNNKPKYCMKHAENGMVIVTGKGCQFQGCKNRSHYYDFPGEKGKFCNKHREPGMVDVSNPKCEELMCDSLASYGIPGAKKTRCAKHRQPGMLTKPRAKCIVCKKQAVYGKNFVPSHCEEHKSFDDDNLMERECISCHLTMILDKNNKCEYCDPVRFQTNRLAKQNALMDYLDRKGLRGNSTDIVIDNGTCGKERPDRIFDFEDKILILECDEHQHRDRQCECEQTRMVNISQSYGGIPVYFIRWNPDNYTTMHSRLPELIQKRYLTLAKYIDNVRMNLIQLPTALLSVCYMYYDGWDGVENMEWKTVLSFESS